MRILDFYHPADISGFEKRLFKGDEKQYTPWAEERIALLRNSGLEEAMSRLERHKGKALPAGVVNPYTSIEHNKNKTGYDGSKRLG